MTGPGHFREAERLASEAEKWADAGWMASMSTEERIARRAGDLTAAQVHATLALAAATALGNLLEGGPMTADRQAWIATASEHPAQKRASAR